ncbi:DUF2285 domain-containing protein [Maricaulis sp.]|uniref:DNA -binding domain-containing protein n=1 Tax=Maricaulis sp. TaxID=1486257 RepID=UPI0032971F9B
MSASSEAPILDIPPNGDAVTDYDRHQAKLYARLLDAEKAGAALEEIAPVLLGIDAKAEPDRARQVHKRHLNRARWMTEHGYRELLKTAPRPESPLTS